MILPGRKTILKVLLILVLAAGGYLLWRGLQPTPLPAGIASGNGRIEGTQIDVATKIPGRIAEVLVNEGEFVTAGQVLARMDTASLEAQLREARAQLQRARIGIDTANSLVAQRNSEKTASEAVVLQRQAQLDAFRRRLARTEELAAGGNAPRQTLDDDRAAFEGARAALAAATAQVAANQAAISSARGQIVAAQADAEAAQATIERIQVDIDDSALKAPRDGRIQYRVAQPGEILAAGGRVLNMVDVADVYMTFFLPTEAAGQLSLGAEARIVLDAAPQFVIPAAISLVADVAQFTPRAVETAEERVKLMFRVRARVSPDLLREHIDRVKTGLPGMAYVRIDPATPWPENLQVRLPR